MADLAPGDADDLVAGSGEILVLAPVAFKRGRVPMKPIPVDLYHQPRGWPQRVDLIPRHPHIGLRPREPRLLDDGTEPALGLRAREPGLGRRL
jgi:hypothetical protein